MPLLARQVRSFLVVGALGVLAIVASAVLVRALVPEGSPTADALLVGMSVIGAGVVFGTPALRLPVAWRDRSTRWLVAAKVAGTAAMTGPGFAVLHLFGDEDSGSALVRLALALWLPAVVLVGLGALIGALTDEGAGGDRGAEGGPDSGGKIADPGVE